MDRLNACIINRILNESKHQKHKGAETSKGKETVFGIHIVRKRIEQVKEFCYLGNIITIMGVVRIVFVISTPKCILCCFKSLQFNATSNFFLVMSLIKTDAKCQR